MTNYIIGEHYYTTSKFKNGLFTLDQAKFLNADEVDALEKSGVYQTASGLNNNPTDEEIKSDFPITLAFYKLPSSGRFVYLRSQYTGRANHTPDRFGNFFSHSVILKESQPASPASFFFNQFENSFKKDFSIQEDENFKPQLTEREIQIDSQYVTAFSHGFNHFCGFLQKENNLKIFSKVLDLIVDGILTTKGNNITICAGKEQVREIILAVNFFLPQHIANKISFATYVNNPNRYPFQLTGIIPECSITSLDSRYYTLVDTNPNFDHEAKHDYTKFLVEVINEKSDQSFERWKELNNEIKALGISEPNSRLNAPISFRNFVRDIQQKEIQDFKNLLSLNLPMEKVNELKKITLEKNPELYLKYVLSEMKNAKSRATWFNEKRDAYSKIYFDHFENNNFFRENYLPYLVEEFREGLSATERSQASLHVILTSNCKGITTKDWLNERFQEADYWFENEFTDIEQKLEPVKNLNENYELSTFQEIIPNIMKVKSFDDIRKAAEKGNFFNFLDKNEKLFSELKDSEKQTAFLIAMNSENRKGQFDLTFNKYIRKIEKYFKENDSDFWVLFFEKNKNWNPNNEFNKHTLDFLKKKFVASIFHSELYRFELYEKLNLDSYSKKWIQEDITEYAKKESIIEKFYEKFENDLEIRNSKGFDLFKYFRKK